MISDQCPYSVKVASYVDADNTSSNDYKEFIGSIFFQLEEVETYLSLNNRVKSTYEGLKRIDSYDYPPLAIREALLNSITHKDYSFNSSIIININPYEIEFISIGGLLPPLTKEDILSGISISRNKPLAELFRRLKLVEAYGSGLRKIFSFYKDCPRQPSILLTENTFKLILPNLNVNPPFPRKNKVPKAENSKTSSVYERQLKLIYEYLSEYEEIDDETIQSLLEIKKTRSYLLTRKLEEEGVLTHKGRGDKKVYKLK